MTSQRPDRDALHFPSPHRDFLETHLPPVGRVFLDEVSISHPFTTLTFATSLDSQLALSPGIQTVLSGPQSKAMTHYLRSRHDAILIGVGTAVADDPSLNCRLEGVGGYGASGLTGQPRPIVIDLQGRWEFTEEHKIFKLARQGKGQAPWIVKRQGSAVDDQRRAVLSMAGGKYIKMDTGIKITDNGRFDLDWDVLLRVLRAEGIRSVMIEGGATVINSILVPEYLPMVHSVIVTIAPTWLGRGGVLVSPPRRLDNNGKPMTALRLECPKWHSFGDDVVLCGRPKS